MRSEFKRVDNRVYRTLCRLQTRHFDATVRNATRFVTIRNARDRNNLLLVNSRSILSHELKLSIYNERSGKLSSSRFLSVDGISTRSGKREREKERGSVGGGLRGIEMLRSGAAARFRNIPRVTLFREGSAGIDSTRRPRGQWSPVPDPPAGPDRRPP